MCFYYDEKYFPSHKCSGQLHSLEVVIEGTEDAGEEVSEECTTELFTHDSSNDFVQDASPQIFIHALSGITSHRTMRIRGYVRKQMDGDGGRRNKAFLHMLCILDRFLDVLFKCVKLAKFLLYLVSSHGWLGLSTQPTPREVDSVKALGANGVLSGSRVGVVWMEVGGGIVRTRVVSRVVVKVVLMVLSGCVIFERWFWMGELSLEETSMKSVCGIFFGGFWVEELALETIEYDDQGMEYEEGCLKV
ncbi:hypothetical protein Tco_0468000 [Tanacetum coccineum]